MIILFFQVWIEEATYRTDELRMGRQGRTFKEGVMNSCNPAFMDVGARVGVDGMYQTFRQLDCLRKQGSTFR